MKMPPSIADRPWYHSRLASAMSVAATFVFVAVGWVPFMTDLKTARHLLAVMFVGEGS